MESFAASGWVARNEKSFLPEGNFEEIKFQNSASAERRGDFNGEKNPPRDGLKQEKEGDRIDIYETVRRYLENEKFSLCQKQERGRGRILVVFIVDSSGSMATGGQISHAKQIVRETVRKNRGKTVKFSAVALCNDTAEILSPPGTGAGKFIQNLRNLKTGGRTNMSAGIEIAGKIMRKTKREKKCGEEIHIFTDGRINFCSGGGDPFEQSVKKFKTVVRSNVKTTVVDTESGFVEIGAAAKFAEAIGAKYSKAQGKRRE